MNIEYPSNSRIVLIIRDNTVPDGVSQEACVVQPETGHAGHYRPLDDVGAVVLAADPHLDDSYVHVLGPEDVEGQDGEKLEVGRPILLIPVPTDLVINSPEM